MKNFAHLHTLPPPSNQTYSKSTLNPTQDLIYLSYSSDITNHVNVNSSSKNYTNNNDNNEGEKTKVTSNDVIKIEVYRTFEWDCIFRFVMKPLSKHSINHCVRRLSDDHPNTASKTPLKLNLNQLIQTTNPPSDGNVSVNVDPCICIARTRTVKIFSLEDGGVLGCFVLSCLHLRDDDDDDDADDDKDEDGLPVITAIKWLPLLSPARAHSRSHSTGNHDLDRNLPSKLRSGTILKALDRESALIGDEDDGNSYIYKVSSSEENTVKSSPRSRTKCRVNGALSLYSSSSVEGEDGFDFVVVENLLSLSNTDDGTYAEQEEAEADDDYDYDDHENDNTSGGGGGGYDIRSSTILQISLSDGFILYFTLCGTLVRTVKPSPESLPLPLPLPMNNNIQNTSFTIPPNIKLPQTNTNTTNNSNSVLKAVNNLTNILTLTNIQLPRIVKDFDDAVEVVDSFLEGLSDKINVYCGTGAGNGNGNGSGNDVYEDKDSDNNTFSTATAHGNVVYENIKMLVERGNETINSAFEDYFKNPTSANTAKAAGKGKGKGKSKSKKATVSALKKIHKTLPAVSACINGKIDDVIELVGVGAMYWVDYLISVDSSRSSSLSSSSSSGSNAAQLKQLAINLRMIHLNIKRSQLQLLEFFKCLDLMLTYFLCLDSFYSAGSGSGSTSAGAGAESKVNAGSLRIAGGEFIGGVGVDFNRNNSNNNNNTVSFHGSDKSTCENLFKVTFRDFYITGKGEGKGAIRDVHEVRSLCNVGVQSCFFNSSASVSDDVSVRANEDVRLSEGGHWRKSSSWSPNTSTTTASTSKSFDWYNLTCTIEKDDAEVSTVRVNALGFCSEFHSCFVEFNTSNDEDEDSTDVDEFEYDSDIDNITPQSIKSSQAQLSSRIKLPVNAVVISTKFYSNDSDRYGVVLLVVLPDLDLDSDSDSAELIVEDKQIKYREELWYMNYSDLMYAQTTLTSQTNASVVTVEELVTSKVLKRRTIRSDLLHPSSSSSSSSGGREEGRLNVCGFRGVCTIIFPVTKTETEIEGGGEEDGGGLVVFDLEDDDDDSDDDEEDDDSSAEEDDEDGDGDVDESEQ